MPHRLPLRIRIAAAAALSVACSVFPIVLVLMMSDNAVDDNNRPVDINIDNPQNATPPIINHTIYPIPKVIYMTSKSYGKVVRRNVERMKNVHPQFTVEFYDDERGKEFLIDNFDNDQQYIDTFNSLRAGPHKADFLRYCLLYKYGGYYFDTEIFPIQSIDQCFPSNLTSTLDLVSTLAGANHCGQLCDSTRSNYNFSLAWYAKKCQPCNHVHNGFMIARKGSSILGQLIQFMIQNPKPAVNEWLPCTNPYHFYVKAYYSHLLNITGSKFIEPNQIYTTKGIGGARESFFNLNWWRKSECYLGLQ